MDNSICNFEDIFKKLPKQKINVISTCIFKLNNGYKDFSNYIDGSKRLKKFANKIKWYLLIFIDNSIYNDKEIFDKLKENTYDEKTIYIKYDCPKFKRDEDFHKGLFGTLIRFFPIFDFPNNPFKNVMITDIDYYNGYDKIFYTYYILLKKYKLDSICNVYELLEYGDCCRSLTIPYKNKDNVAMIACCLLFNKKKINHNLIINYLNTIMDHNSELYKDLRSKLMHLNIDDVFAYGVDEYFLCHILYYYFEKINYKIYYMTSYKIINPFNFIYQKYINNENTKEVNKEFLKSLQYILHQPNNKDIKQLYNILEKIIGSYNLPLIDKSKNIITTLNYNSTTKQQNVCKDIYDYIENLYTKHNYKLFDKQTLEYILKNKGIIKCKILFNKKSNKYIRFYSYYKI